MNNAKDTNCSSCGTAIEWKTDFDRPYPVNADGSLHRCKPKHVEETLATKADVLERLRSRSAAYLQAYGEDDLREVIAEVKRLRATLESVAQAAQEAVAYVDESGNEQYQRGMEDAGKAILYTLEHPNV